MEIIIVTGLSGAGKSQAAKFIEDAGYYCIDNMPPGLMGDFINLCINGSEELRRIALIMDVRGGEFFSDMESSLEEVRAMDYHLKILFFEASDEVLIRRYKETRREHPLSKGDSIAEGIARERDKLSSIRALADHIVDTGSLRTTELRAIIGKIISADRETAVHELTIVLTSFGFKTGIPLDADYVFDVRFIPNPFYLASMKRLTGNSKKVRDYVMKWPEAQEFVQKTYDLLGSLIPYHIREGKSSLMIAIGCTGGQHRSVTVTNRLHELFAADGRSVVIKHREL